MGIVTNMQGSPNMKPKNLMLGDPQFSAPLKKTCYESNPFHRAVNGGRGLYHSALTKGQSLLV